MSEQKPMSMDTAPKDGTHILGYGKHTSQNDYGIGWSQVSWRIDRNGGHSWYGTNSHPSEITAWLPLPPTPTEET